MASKKEESVLGPVKLNDVQPEGDNPWDDGFG
jgi:hypothetical protein